MNILISQFPKDKAETFLERLIALPLTLASLMRRRLEPEVLDIARDCGLQVFPTSWRDLGMECSCPDWAVPCKHLAAAIYKVSEEIDNNPFLVFELHGLDILGELKSRGLLVEAASCSLEPISVQELLERSSCQFGTPVWKQCDVDFSTLPSIGSDVLELLSANPSFSFCGDFKKIYARHLNIVGRHVAKVLSAVADGQTSMDAADATDVSDASGVSDAAAGRSGTDVSDTAVMLTDISDFSAVADVRFAIDRSFGMTVSFIGVDGKTSTIPFGSFVNMLGLLSPSVYPACHPWVEVMHRMWLLACNLLVLGNVVPRIVSAGCGYRILWQPAMLRSEVRTIVNMVTECVPNVVFCSDGIAVGSSEGRLCSNDTIAGNSGGGLCSDDSNVGNVGNDCNAGKSSHSEEVFVGNAGEWLLWNMLNVIVASVGRQQCVRDPLFDMFFLDLPQRFDAIGQGGVAGGIKVWTDKFFTFKEDGGFALHVEEHVRGFAVSLFVFSEAGDALGGRYVRFDYFLDAPAFSRQQVGVMAKLVSLIDYLPELRDYLMARGTTPILFNHATFVPFLFKTLPLMRLLGVEIVLPKSLERLAKPKVSVMIDSRHVGSDGTGHADRSYLHLDELLTFDWRVSLGDTLVSPDEFSDIMHRAGELVKFKGQYVYATVEELEKIGKLLAKGEKLSSMEILSMALTESYNGTPATVTPECRELLHRLREPQSFPMPSGLHANLRPYQERGYEWMMHNLLLGFGAIIADDMGLGKTLQVIAVLLQYKENGRLDSRRALVVVPTGLLTNWQNECARFAPTLRVGIYHGPTRDIGSFDADVMITSYGVARSDAAILKKHKWELLVIDEAQNIKNAATAQTKAVCSIPANARIAMSGTPVENRLSDYWSIMNFANKGLFGSLKKFNTSYARPIHVDGNKSVAERFRAMTSPFLLRRLKSDKTIISDLPDKVERDEYASLTPDQSALYQQTLNAAMREIEGVEATNHASLFKREGLVLQMIMALKQICNHPAQFLKDKRTDAQFSGKAMMLVDLVRGIVDSGEKVLVFTQFKEMGDLIVKMLGEAGIPSMFYHGGCTLKRRAEMVERFQRQPSAQVFVLSLKAAGTGLNLTAATNVIHFDLWWNPAVEAQATDRAYRIGQHRNVQVYRFITKGTFEERINAMIQDKKQLADLTVGTGEKWLASMSDGELRSIFALN